VWPRKAALILAAALAGLIAAAALVATTGGAAPRRAASIGASTGRGATTAPGAAVSLAKMLGQQVVSRTNGTSPEPALLARIRAGQVGGVILYGVNIVSPTQTQTLVRKLQAAARAGHNPPLLILTDQEGGEVKRLGWAPPTIPPPQMGIDGASVSRAQGIGTGAALHEVGINVDLAPEIDVAHSGASFLWQEGRSFGMTPSRVIDSAIPFGLGLMHARVAATAKHFPGLGGALTDTDLGTDTLSVGPRDLAPYRSAIKSGIPLIMIANAYYPGLARSGAPAPLSHRIVTGLLREKLGYRGAVITDDLMRLPGYNPEQAVLRAEDAGDDLIVALSDDQEGETLFHFLLTAVRRGQIPKAAIQAAYERIMALKQTYG
jgi:beta-N-acetylhexosaminidase